MSVLNAGNKETSCEKYEQKATLEIKCIVPVAELYKISLE